ncbi:MAG TPA: hypothetical protein VFH51_07200, partial [Myxococcota bacterium]|nr:hypothetical protein [Myxococcota bacterium]
GSRLQAVALGQRALSVTTSQDYPGAFACALLADRQVKCWGSNARGQLGLGDTVTRPAPADDTIDFGPGRSVLKVSAGARHACAVLDDGQIACWGDNVTAFVWVLGYGAAEPFLPAPTRRVPLAAGRTAVDVEAGNFSTCALLDDGTVTCWGFNNWGQLGYGDTVGRATPGAPLNFGGARIASISSGYDTRCAVTADGALRCWGRSGTGLLGSNDPNRATSPLARAAFDFGGRRVVEASAGLTICVRLDNGEVRCFGRNGAGQAGIGTTQPVLATQSSPIELGRGRSSVSISSREGFSLGSAVCAILDDGTLHCWGGNAQGQLGLGDAINRGTAPQNLPSTYPATKLW